ncbi:MAG: inositol monophosphatase family protein [Halobacteriales archaeon]|nr:inositol monophosphatase family protein [Halobacteriales archaeon]
MEFSDEVETAKEAAYEAGDVMRRYRRDGFGVEQKGSRTNLVTEADREAQESVVEILCDEFPEDGVLAEEDDLQPDGEDRVWVIDPIDGTTNFVHGFPYYCVSIALRVEGETKVGVVSAPPFDETYHAVRGQGAFSDGDMLSVSETSDPRDALVSAGVYSWASDETNEVQTRLVSELVGTPVSFRFAGASALEYCHLAHGYFDGMLQVLAKPWDVEAGTLVVEEAGGTVRERDSVVDGYVEVVASNGRLQGDLEEIFDRNVRTGRR